MDDPVWSREDPTSGWPFETLDQLKAATARYWNLHPDERDTLLRVYAELVRDLCRDYGVDEPALWAIAQERLHQVPVPTNNGSWWWIGESTDGPFGLIDNDGELLAYDFQTIRLLSAYAYARYGDVLERALFKTESSIIEPSPAMLQWFSDPERTDEDLRNLPPVGALIATIDGKLVWAAHSFTHDAIHSFPVPRTGYVADAFARLQAARERLRISNDVGSTSWEAEDEYCRAKIAAAQAFYEWQKREPPLDKSFYPVPSMKAAIDIMFAPASRFNLPGGGLPPRTANGITYGEPGAILTPLSEGLYLAAANRLGPDHVPTVAYLLARSFAAQDGDPTKNEVTVSANDLLEFRGIKKDAEGGEGYKPETKRREMQRVLELQPIHLDAKYKVLAPKGGGMKDMMLRSPAFHFEVEYEPAGDPQLPFPDRFQDMVPTALRARLGGWSRSYVGENISKQFANVHEQLFQYKPGNGRVQEFALLIGVYLLAYQFRVRALRGNWNQPLIRETILAGARIEIPDSKVRRFREYFRDALDLLQRDGQIDSWRTVRPVSENDPFASWLKDALIILPPKPLREHYDGWRHHAMLATMKYALPSGQQRKRKAPSSNGSTKPRKRTARAT